MHLDPDIKIGSFFAAGFNISPDVRELSEKTYMLNGMIENLFNLRFNREIIITEKPQLSAPNRLELSCELNTVCNSISQRLDAKIQVRFAYILQDAEQGVFELNCTDIMQFIIHEEDSSESVKFSEWAEDYWVYDLHAIMNNLKAMISRYPHYFYRLLSLNAGDLRTTLEAETIRHDKTKHYYYAALVELNLDGAVTEQSLLLKSITIKDAAECKNRKAVLYALATHYNMHHAVHSNIITNLKQGLTLDEYAESDMDVWNNLSLKSPSGYNSAQLKYINRIDLAEFEKLSEVISVNLELM